MNISLTSIHFNSSSSSSYCCNSGIIKFYKNRNQQHPHLFRLSPPVIHIVSAAPNLPTIAITTTTTTRRRIRRRTNHLRKKLQEQVPITTTVVVNVDNSSEQIILNPVLVNQLETWASANSSSSSAVLPLDNNNNQEILTTTQQTNIIQQLIPTAKLWGAFLLVFITFTATSFLTTKTPPKQQTSLDKEMLRRKFKSRSNSDNTNTTVEPLTQHSKLPPQLDKQQLINTILNSTPFKNNQIEKQITTSSSSSPTQPNESFHLPQHHLTTDPTLLHNHQNGNTHLLMPQQPGDNLLVQKKPRIITSLKEARHYLHNKKPNIPNPIHFSANHTTNPGTANVKQPPVTANPREDLDRANRDKWMEDNFHEFQPIVDKIRAGFSNNYKLAKEKLKEDVDDIVSDLKMLQRDDTETELEWMKDEKLSEIVFQVRENELMGRDPFYLMDHQDKAMFFKGLENKVEKETEKLQHLHEYLHSNIENLDYGADGISLYDPPEKIIPRWKGPPPATTMSQEFLDDYLHQRKSLFAETLGNSDLVKSDSQDSLQSTNKTVESKNLKSSKTVIEGSDGSVKPGKKSGKEFWQHTKKWSRGFIDSYNAENDPETKAVMKDIGKDLDRWITEKEIKATADIMDKVPDKGKKFIAEKINKLKTEMELFGPQAVVSKYSEYGEEEEIDYYWWLDLPFLLCIELYIDGDEDERIGFYSLEMASDLELDPKPHHIIAFEDTGDCKNFCYIIQAHMEMLGNGNAFVVPQLPKDTYQEAKTNGFNVTVIRKGELKLDVDQTLEEVEEKLAEIGSKMYHDKIMKGRNVDVDSVMKGVFGLNKSPKRSRSKKKLKKPIK